MAISISVIQRLLNSCSYLRAIYKIWVRVTERAIPSKSPVIFFNRTSPLKKEKKVLDPA
jgi:hypothetical protein